MENLDSQTEQAIKKLVSFERTMHGFKIAVYTILAAIIIAVNFYTFHRLYQNSDKNRLLLRCTVVAITTDKTPDKFQSDLNNCLEETK